MKKKDYYEYLKGEIGSFKGDFASVIFYLPEFFRLLCELLTEHLKSGIRIKIYAVLGYLIAPYDVIPEAIFGPAGYIDDLYLCSYMLMEIKSEYGPGLLEKHWHFDEKIGRVLDASYEASKKEMENMGLAEKILSHVGFK